MSFDSILSNQVQYYTGLNKTKWSGSKFEAIKHLSTTHKGDFGEEFITDLLNEIGVKAERINKGKGPFDVFAKPVTRLEIKLATEDTNGNFQFNGIKKDVGYDYVVCLGVSPNEMWFNIFSKEQCQDLTTPMVKDGSDTFKLTATKSQRSKWFVKPLTNEMDLALEVERYV
jgi:hypothetical protein